MRKKSPFNLSSRVCSSILIILHLITFGPIRDAFGFSASSASYKLSSGALNSGGKDRASATTKLWMDSIGEPSIGKAQSASYVLNAGYIPTVQSNPPVQTQIIPNQLWDENQAKPNAFDLDNYFSSPDGYSLSYSVAGNSSISVSIDPNTHIVSFSQPQNWYGTEQISFTAADTEYNSLTSNQVTLQVEYVNNPPVLDFIPDITVNENDLVKITPHATDADGDVITYSFTAPLNAQGEWQTNYNSAGIYTVTVTASDATGLKATQSVHINVKNINRPPVINPTPDITANEGSLITVMPVATDPDNDAITFYYTSPLDNTGKWFTDYNSAGTYTATITASDGIDTVQQPVKIIVNNVNRAPHASLTLSKYTVYPNEQLSISLFASDPDGDPMTFSIKKDGQVISSGDIADSYSTTTTFPSSGDYTIIATVTDSGGLSSTDSKGIDVVDPNANRDYINPVMGDFNGDALSDLGLHNSDTGKWEICLSNKGVFNNAVDWLTGFGTSKDWWPIGGDYNGDGKSDIGIYNNTTGELKIALSTGSGFTVQGTWLTFSGASYSWQPFTGNFNADKYTDFALYNKDTGEVKVALGTGTGFGSFNTWISGFGNDYVAMAGDFNGDSLTDLCLFKKSSGEFKVAFSNTKTFVDGSTWISGYATDKDALISDFNNDGLADIGYWDKSSLKWYSAISTGATFIDKGLWLENFGTSEDESATTGDFNGDGVTDAATFDRDDIGINRWTTKLSTNKPADLLTEIDNGIGGKTRVTYTYASMYDNADLPFPVYVASSTRLINTYPADRTAAYAQNFTYSGGYFDSGEREFRGFAKVRVTDPITNNYSETYFYQGKPGQDGALKGQIEKIISSDGNAKKISETYSTYEVRKSGPSENVLGAPFLTEQTTTIYEENATYITTKDKFTYDNIGNLLEQVSEGDVAKTGDEKSSATVYAQAYEIGFNRPLETALKDKDGNTVSKKNFEYDEKGNLVKDAVLIFNPLTNEQVNPQTFYSYDSFGNLTSTTNALGSSVTTEYETTFYAYPQKVTNSLGHTIQYTYEPKFGAVKSVTDTNGQTSATTYDSLGRVTQVKNAYNQITATYSYPDFNTKITTNAIGLSATEYIDGLGRKYKAVSTGEDGNSARQVSSEIFFDNRGLTEKESLAHYTDEDPAQISYVRYEYDIRGRVIKTISDFPGTLKDAQATVSYINPLYVETIDPHGHKKGTLKDVYGNITEVTEFTSGGVYHTYYEYDTQGNLLKTTDSQGNITRIFYDSIGRKIKMLDPDMGTWLYEYDILGNLIQQTDAKGQILEFTYDVLNRLTEKKGLSPEGGLSLTLATYIYDDANKQNCIGRLSKITDQSGSTEFFYDKLGREIKSIKGQSPAGTVPEFFTVERTYDILDRLTTLKYPDGETVNYTYDVNSGLLEKVEGLSPQGTVPYVQDITYNAKSQINVIKYGNGTQTNYTYGQDLRLSRILTQGSTALQDLNYIFDKNGNITTLTDNLRSNIRTFVYDELDRLTTAQNIPAPGGGYTNFNYQYDSIGNMTYKSDIGVMTYGEGLSPQGTVPKPHALTSAGGYSYQYDVNGNMIVGKNKSMSYDVENRLIGVNQSGTITTFAYDGDGGRVKKTSGSNSTIYIGSLFEKDSNGTIRKHIFVGSNRVVTKGLSPEGVLSLSYYHSDHLGSSSVITDQTGAQVSHYEYTPYGSLARNEGSDVVKYKFTGKELDNTGLYFYGARYYDPELGRFISADTIVQAPYDPQSLNRYSYCRNNPINYVDPTGHWSWKKFWNSFAGAVLGVALTIVLGPAGLGMSMAMAGMWGGIAGGALTGSLNGGWQGALIGGAMGGILGGIGGWAVGGGHTGVLAGMFVAGAGVAGATDSWDSFAGGIAGVAAGSLAGGAITSAYKEQFGNFRAGNGFVSNQDAAAKAAASLKIDLSDDPPVLIYNRGIQDGSDGKPYGIKIHPIMKDWEGNYHELENANGKIRILEGKLSNTSPATRAYMAGNPRPDDMTMVYGSKFFQAIKSYKATYEGKPYVLFDSLNKNPDEFNCVGFKNYVINNSKYE